MDQLKEISEMRKKLDYFKLALLKTEAKNQAEIEKCDKKISKIDIALKKVHNSPSLTLSEGLNIISEI